VVERRTRHARRRCSHRLPLAGGRRTTRTYTAVATAVGTARQGPAGLRRPRKSGQQQRRRRRRAARRMRHSQPVSAWVHRSLAAARRVTCHMLVRTLSIQSTLNGANALLCLCTAGASADIQLIFHCTEPGIVDQGSADRCACSFEFTDQLSVSRVRITG
jgi:hypothetical protein